MAVVEEVGVGLIVEGWQQFLKTMGMADKEVDSLGSTSQKTSSILDGALATALGVGIVKAAEAAINAIIGLGKAVINLGKEGLQAYADYELLQASLTSLVAREMVNTGAADDLASAMGNAGGRAEELLGWVQQLAIESPFTQKGVAAAFKTALAYGFTSDEAQRLTGAMIDFAAGSGATEGSMNQIALALGQIQAKGKLSGQEVLQLVNAGLAVDQILAKAFGKSTAEIVAMREKGLIPADAAIEAIVSSLETDFGGAAKRQASTFSGLISTLEDIKEVGLREFFTGTFQAIQPYLTQFVDTLSSPEFMATIRDIGMQLGAVIANLLTNLPVVIAFISQNIMPVFGEVVGFITGEFIPGVTELGGTFTQIFNGIYQAVATVIPLVIQYVQMVAPFWQQMADFIMSAIQNVVAFVLPLLESMAQFFVEKIGFIVAWVKTNLPLIQATFDTIMPIIQSVWETAWTAIMLVLQSVWTVIQTIINVALDVIFGIITAVMQAIQGDWEGVWETIKSTAESVWEALKTGATEFVNTILTAIGTTMSEVKATWKSNWDALVTIASTIWERIKSTISDAIESVKGFFQNANWGEIGRSVIDGIVNGIRNAAGAVAEALSGVLDAAIAAAKAALGIGSPSKVAFDLMANFMGTAENTIKDMTPRLQMQMTAAITPQVQGFAPATSNISRVVNNSVVNNNSNVTNNTIRMTPALALETVGMTAV